MTRQPLTLVRGKVFVSSVLLFAFISSATADNSNQVFHAPWFPNAVKPIAAVPPNDPDAQELANIAAQRRAAIQTALSRPDKESLLLQIRAAEIDELEQFVATRTNSLWTPSLRASLGKFQRDTGRYSLALEHWGAAYEACRSSATAEGRETGEYALAQLARLLASLGRVEALDVLFAENANRLFAVGRNAQIWIRTREAYARMVREPAVAYKCGVYALDNVARALYGTNVIEIMRQPSPVTGFSLAELWTLADRHGLGLVPVLRESGTELAVPSLVHWKENHYATIIAKHGEGYEVVDPTFGTRHIMDAQTLNAEASGYFMVRATTLPGGCACWAGRKQRRCLVEVSIRVFTTPTIKPARHRPIRIAALTVPQARAALEAQVEAAEVEVAEAEEAEEAAAEAVAAVVAAAMDATGV